MRAVFKSVNLCEMFCLFGDVFINTVSIPDEEDDLTVKQQEQLHAKDTLIDTATAEYLDKKSLYAQLTADEEKVLKMLDDGATQKKIASELEVTQGYVSTLKAQAQFNYDYLEYCSAVKTRDGEFIWKCWNLFAKKLEMPIFLDVEIEFVLRYLHPNDIAHFLHWYYSLGEFIRFTLSYYLYNESEIEKDKQEYLSKVSDQELAWFNQNYADSIPLVQIVYIRLITEVERRRSSGLHGNDKAVEGLYTAVEKLAKRVNISPEEYFAERLYPIIANIRNRRLRQFYRFYMGKNLKK